MQVNGTRMLRVRAVADMFDVSPQTIYRAIEAGELSALRIGTAVRIPEESVRAYAAARVISGCVTEPEGADSEVSGEAA